MNIEDFERDLDALIERYRKDGLGPLEISDALNAAADAIDESVMVILRGVITPMDHGE